MSSSEAAWPLGVDLAFVDRRLGANEVDRLLEDGREHARGSMVLDTSERLCAALVRDRRDPIARPEDAKLPAIALRLRVRGDALELACACSPGRQYLCVHGMTVLVDLAVHPRLRAALAANAPTDALLAELPALRHEAYEERTLDARLDRWLPPRAFDDDLEIDVEVVRSAGLAAGEERPALLLRHRRPGSRVPVRPRDVLESRLAPWHRRLIELTSPGHMDKSTLVSTRAQASMLLQLLRAESPVFTRGWKTRLRFANAAVAPRLEAVGERLVARWYTSPDGRHVADAERALLFTGPFPYVWSELHEIFHPVAPEVDLDVAWGLSRVPSLPLTPRSTERIGRALFARGRGLGVELPVPELFGLPPLEAPSFELRLTGTPLDVRGELHAVYRAGRFLVTPRHTEADGRDHDAEAQMLQRIHEASLRADEQEDIPLRAVEDDAVELWQRGIASLRAIAAPPIEILLEPELARVKVGPPLGVQVHVGVASGWLDTELDFRAGALAVEMGRLRAVLASRGRWVALSDGTLSKISDEVAGLIDASAGLLDAHGRGRLAPHQLGRVERWIARFGGELDAQATTLRSRLRALAVRTEPDLPTQLEATLRPYQLRGIAWLQFLRELGAGGVLADDMGLGKTLMTLTFLARWKEDAPKSMASLVVRPTSVVGSWVKEAKRFVPQLRVLVLHGGARGEKLERIGDHDLVITTYAVLRRDVERLSHVRFRCAILDEAQNVKNADAATTRAARRIDAEMRLALSGTPIENRLEELWSIMSFVNPGMLGTRSDFEERFDKPITNYPDGAVAEELRALVRPLLLRRTKAEVLADLPPKTEIDLGCVLGLRQKRLYDALALTLREAVKKDIQKRGLARSRLSVLTAILRLRQLACDPRLVDPTVPATESAKRTAFLELVRELVASDRRALVFSQFVELFALWRQDLDREGIAYEYLDGASVERESIVERFQEGSAPLFLISLKAGGAGLNLTAADTVIHCDPWWNPAVEDQATDRAHRMGQARAVTVVRLVATGTIEEKIAVLKGKKRELAAAVMGDGLGATEGALRGLSDDDVRGLLGALDVHVVDEPSETIESAVAVRPELVAPREIDELRAILRRVESSGTPRKTLARKVGLPEARVALLLIGHRVPISTKIAGRIRALL